MQGKEGCLRFDSLLSHWVSFPSSLIYRFMACILWTFSLSLSLLSLPYYEALYRFPIRNVLCQKRKSFLLQKENSVTYFWEPPFPSMACKGTILLHVPTLSQALLWYMLLFWPKAKNIAHFHFGASRTRIKTNLRHIHTRKSLKHSPISE